MGNNNRWRPPSIEEKHDLERLLKEIPTRTVVTIEWKSPEGREFVKTLREIQLRGVSVPEIANALDVTTATLQGAIAYWARTSPVRGGPGRRTRERRRLGRRSEED